MAELTIAGLRVLREVAASGSFSTAGQRLGYTQSAVSRQIAALEAAAGEPLFTRTNRGVRLTETGSVLLRHAAAVLEQVAAAERDLAQRPGGPHWRVRLGAFSSAMAGLVPRALRRLATAAPHIRVTLREGTTPVQLRRVAAGTADLAIVGGEPGRIAREYPGVAVEWLADDPLLLAVARDHPLAAASSVHPGELVQESWIVASGDAAENLLGAWDAAGWTPRVAFTVRDWTVKLGLVAHGHGVTIVPGISAHTVPGNVTLVRIADPGASRKLLIARPAEATTGEPAQAVVRALRDVIAGLTLPLSATRAILVS